MKIVMQSDKLRVTKTRKTQAHYWKDVNVGDIMRFSQTVKRQGMGRGLYAVDITVENLTQGITFSNTMNQISANMNGFEFEVAKEDDANA